MIDIIAFALLIICISLMVSVLARGFWKPFACKVGWHSYKYDYIGHDGASEHAKCQWCKYKGMVDSQDNLF
jgi:hypothetical protein